MALHRIPSLIEDFQQGEATCLSQQFSEGNNQPPLLAAFIHWCSGTSGNLAFYVHLIPLTILTHPVESFHIHSHKLYSMLNKFYIRSVSYVI